MASRHIALTAALATGLFATCAAWAGATDKNPVPVMVGGEADLDACGAVGDVHGLNPDGDGFLAVRSGPGTDYTQIDSLYEGDKVILCDRQGKWIGIVYPGEGQEDTDCGVASPIPERQAYDGPCKSGWVYEKWIRLLAG